MMDIVERLNAKYGNNASLSSLPMEARDEILQLRTEIERLGEICRDIIDLINTDSSLIRHERVDGTTWGGTVEDYQEALREIEDLAGGYFIREEKPGGHR